jgi:NADPH-dependent curcumin reductase CurA
MSDAPSYASPVEVGDVMVGGTISRVETSAHPEFKAGDMVLGYNGWQSYALSDGSGLTRLDPLMKHPSYALGILGMPGFTAYMGLLDIGHPKAGETVVVSAASGAVGSVVGQIARLLGGCRVVGIVGDSRKCRFVIDELGFDVCVDRHAADFPEQLAAVCAKGIDVYFENVGGAVFDAVLPLLNVGARVPLCGLIAQCNDTGLTPGPDRLGLLTRTLLTRRIKIQGFIIFDDYGDRFEEFYRQMATWLAQGRIKYREDIVDGLDNAPGAFIGMLEGTNFGKLVVRVSQE